MCKKKIVTVQVFNKDVTAEGSAGGKTAKVRDFNHNFQNIINWLFIEQTTIIGQSYDAPLTKNDLCFKKLKELLMLLAEKWGCPMHSFLDNPQLCWSHKDQLGIGYLITLSNQNFWCSCIVSLYLCWFVSLLIILPDKGPQEILY